MGRNSAIKRYSSSTVGQPIELFESDHGRLPVILNLLASPWIVRASDLKRSDGSCSVKHIEEDIEVTWDGSLQYPSSFTRNGRVYRIDSIIQMWVTECFWWDSRRRVSRRYWRVLARGGVFDLTYDRTNKSWQLIGIQD